MKERSCAGNCMAFCDFTAGCQSTEEVFVLAGCLLDVGKT